MLKPDVAILLVDGQKLLDRRGEEQRYLKSLMFNFRQGLSKLEDDLLEDGLIVEFPRVWILAVEHLRSTVAEFIVTPAALSIGEDFMLLSSAKFELNSDGPRTLDIDLTQRVGLDLIPSGGVDSSAGTPTAVARKV